MSTVERDVAAGYAEAALVPKERYTSREWLAAEYQRLWPRVWQMACRLEEIPEVGDFFEYVIGDQSIIVVRAGQGSLKAFHNACLHRGTRLCQGAGNVGEELLCRFHGWAWNLDGSIREVPDADDFAPECVARSALQLPEVHVEIWGGFVFINMSVDPEPLLDFLAPIPERLAAFEVDKMRLLRYRTTVLDCNWKVGLDAFNEVYHLEATHVWDLSGWAGGTQINARARYRGVEETASGVGNQGSRFNSRDEQGRTVGGFLFEFSVFETHNEMRNVPGYITESTPLGELGDPREAAIAILKNRQFISLAHQDDIDYVRQLPEVPGDVPSLQFLTDVRRAVGRAGGIDYSRIPDDEVLANVDACIYPNMVGPMSAGNWILFRFRPNGDNPDSCLFDVMFLHRYPEGEEPDKVEHEWYPRWQDHDDWGPSLGQDLSNMAHIQAGMHQSTFTGLRLNRQESGIRNHERFLDRYITENDA
jgi:nitrite reductase/ring-hydroxylating ferredoxin subunit